MKQPHRLFLYAALPVLGLGLVGVSAASAAGPFSKKSPEEKTQHQQERLAQVSEITGISVTDLQTAREEGKHLKELAEERGINLEELHAKLAEARKLKMQERLSTLVSEGTITQEQADERLQKIEERIADGEFHGKPHRGHRRGGPGGPRGV